MAGSPRRFSTGLRFLDQQLGGGLEPGGLLALLSPPQSQVELLFRELTRNEHVVYLSTLAEDEEELYAILDPPGDRASEVQVAYRDPESLLADPTAFTDQLPDDVYVIVDCVNSLERGTEEEYLAFLNALKRRVREGGSLALLHGLKEDPPPENRHLTLKRADHVWDLRVEVDTKEISTRLCITKSRQDEVVLEPLPLELGDTVDIDTSRNIA